MITGHVIAGQYATLPLVLQGRHGPEDPLNAIIDTGFTGFLTLPLPRIAQLGFPYQGLIDARLGNGSAAEFDMFAGTVLWDGHLREGIVLAVDGTPLIGMALLAGSRLCLEVTTGGRSPLSGCREADGTAQAGETPDSAPLHPGYLATALFRTGVCPILRQQHGE